MKQFTDYLTEQAKLTLEYHKELNSKFWNCKKLKPEVRKHLIMIADKWAVFAKIPKSAISDMILTGGNANFNYTKFSDLDVHLITDFDQVSECDKTFVNEFLMDKNTSRIVCSRG